MQCLRHGAKIAANTCPVESAVPRQLSVRLPDALNSRLDRIARLARRSKASLVRGALADLVEDLEDLLAAEKVRRRIAAGRERLIPLEALDI